MDPEQIAALLGRVGRVRKGEHTGMYVEIEQEKAPGSEAWHIWLLKHDPRTVSPSEGWDIWVDTATDLLEWLGGSLLDVEWLD